MVAHASIALIACSAHGTRRAAPHHRDHRRRARERRLLRAGARAAAGEEDGQLRRADRLPPVLRRRDRGARLDPHLLRVPRRGAGRAGDGMVHAIRWRVGSAAAIDFWERRLARRGRRGRARTATSCCSATPRASRTSCSSPAATTRRSPRTPPTSRPSTRSRASTASAPTRRSRTAAPTLLAALGFASQDDGGEHWRLDGAERHALPLLRRAAAGPRRSRAPGRSTTSPGRRPTTPSCEARARGARRRRPPDADHRPPVLPLGLLPRAERRALRARLARHRLHRRRARWRRSAQALQLPPQHEHLRAHLEQRAHAAARTRAPSRVSDGLPDTLAHVVRPAAGEPAGRARAAARARRRRARPAAVPRPARPARGASSAITPGGPLHLPPGGRHWYAVRASATPTTTRSTRPTTLLVRVPRRAAGRVRRAVGADRPRRVLAGRRHVLRDRASAPGARARPGIVALSCFVPTVEGWSAGPGAARRPARLDRPRPPRPRDQRRVRPRGARPADRGRPRRALRRERRRPPRRPALAGRAAGLGRASALS